MHAYCIQELRLSENSANKRIRVARKGREMPALLAAIADGRLNLSGAVVLAARLSSENADELLAAAAGRAKSEIEEFLAARFPSTESIPMIESLPVATESTPPEEAETSSAVGLASWPVSNSTEMTASTAGQLSPGTVRPPKKSSVAPISRDRFTVTFTIGRST
jgi:hypothetical protein